MKASQDQPFTLPMMQELFTNHELLFRESHRAAPDASAGGVRKVGILGGGTAGWFTALALRAQLPWLEVTVIESKAIPIIGVGEASVPSLVAFLHHYLKLDVLELYREVQPTWKQGIRFEWGQPDVPGQSPYVFQAPFDWEVNGVGMLGSMEETGNVSAFTLQSALMHKAVTPIIRTNGQLQSFLPMLAFAYHLDNGKLVDYLRRTAVARGVTHLDQKIVDAPLETTPGAPPSGGGGGGVGEPRIAHLVAEGGEQLRFDLYVDCSGFRSFLLEKQMGASFTSYASTLFTDTAIAFNAPHGGKPRPYTTARTMQSGWCWNIPMVDDDHLGYVHSSAHCTEDQAIDEARAIWPELKGPRVVKFRSGRHDRAWIGNVFAIGNAYAFVEPLESTGLLMITRAVTALVRAFPLGAEPSPMQGFINTTLGRDWDRLRWFLAAHYKYNQRLDSPFWKEVREKVDVTGIQPAVDLFRAYGPLSLLPRAMRTSLNESMGIYFYGLHGLDCILMGQKVPYPKLEREPPADWKARRANALEFTRRAVSQADALKAVRDRPEWLQQLVSHPSGWVAKMAAYV